jgi:PDDEXK-like domain of unknown function (DUF3799)
MTEIRTLADDEQITEPGFYAISLDRHHSQPCDGPSVTSGVLRKMELATPADVWAFHQLNPRRWEKPQTKALRLGRAMAAYVEGGMEAVFQHFVVLPEDKPNRPTEAQIRACSENRPTEAGERSVNFWGTMDLDPREQITTADAQMIFNMGHVLADDPGAVAAMGGIPEVTMAWRDERTGLWLLSRPDTVSFDGAMTDYKKINTQGRPFNYRVLDSRITEHGYDCQMAFAADVFERLTDCRPDVVGIVGQWDAPPHHVILREINKEDLAIGSWRNRRAIDRFAECLASGDWPGPGADVGAYQRPEWP